MKFRKKPVVIDAFKFDGSFESFSDIKEWFKFEGKFVAEGTFKIETLEGPHIASAGDWIVKGVAGECYPVKPDIFKRTYELVEDQS